MEAEVFAFWVGLFGRQVLNDLSQLVSFTKAASCLETFIAKDYTFPMLGHF